MVKRVVVVESNRILLWSKKPKNRTKKMARSSRKDDTFGFKSSSGVDYSLVMDRQIEDKRFERQRAIRSGASVVRCLSENTRKYKVEHLTFLILLFDIRTAQRLNRNRSR